MAIAGLGGNKKPFIYLDNFVPSVDMEALHTEISYGIAKAEWNKRYVSSGYHKNYKDIEVTPYIYHSKEYLTAAQSSIMESFTTTDEKIKFINALLGIAHPFWLIFIRNNKRIERTGIQNKSVSQDCHWTDNAQYFPTLIKHIESMPFAEIGRVMLFLTESNNQTVPHFDAGTQAQRETKPNDDFIWFSTSSQRKGIFVWDESTEEKTYPDSNKNYLWFNEMDFHGTDASPQFKFSIRIDGKFLPNVKDEILKQD